MFTIIQNYSKYTKCFWPILFDIPCGCHYIDAWAPHWDIQNQINILIYWPVLKKVYIFILIFLIILKQIYIFFFVLK